MCQLAVTYQASSASGGPLTAPALVRAQRRGAIDEHSQEISALHDQKEQLARDTKQARAEIAGLEDRLSQEAVEDAKVRRRVGWAADGVRVMSRRLRDSSAAS